jgi:hypothetical protein
MAKRQRVMVMISRYVRKVTFSVCTMNCPEKRESAGRKQYTMRKMDVKGYIPTLRYAIL